MAFFYKLKLTKQNFEILRDYPGNHLVFQFFYPSMPTGGSPTLYAYSMKGGNQSTDKPPIQLEYDAVSSEPLDSRDQVLGDQQIRVKALKDLIKEATEPAEDYHLLFTPKIDSKKYIYYTIQVFIINKQLLFDDSEDTDPSPPASAIML